MGKGKTARDHGIKIGSLRPGPKNLLTDVQGVGVGHVTLDAGPVKTGVTAILPHTGNLFEEKVVAALHVINGFGKTVGSVQVQELGAIETPIVLTNTFSVGTAYQGLVQYMLAQNPSIGIKTGTVNPFVGECNDGYLNDIRGLHVKTEHVLEAIGNAGADFRQGSVGAGTGMSCYGLKGGIGSASRLLDLAGNPYTIGALVLSNFGRRKDLLINGSQVGQLLERYAPPEKEAGDQGSIIVVLGTDLPLSARQLKRLCQRAQVGIIRTGSYIGHGSGDIAVGFTTANRLKHSTDIPIMTRQMVHEDQLDLLFRAVSEAVEEAILNSLFCADSKIGRNGHHRQSLSEYLHLLELGAQD